MPIALRAPALTALVVLVSCAPVEPPHLEVNRQAVEFGEVEVGGTFRLRVALSNATTIALPVDAVALSPEPPELTLEGLPLTEVAADGREVITVVYAPTAVGAVSSTLRIVSGKQVFELPVSGSAATLGVSAATTGAACAGEATSIDFGEVFNGQPVTRAFTLTGTGTGAIGVGNVRVEPADAGFTLVGPAAWRSIGPGETATYTLQADPRVPGAANGRVVFDTNSFVQPRVEVPFCALARAALLCASPNPLGLGDVALGAFAEQPLRVTSCGNLPVTITGAQLVPQANTAPGLSLSGVPTLPLTLDPGASTTLGVRMDGLEQRASRADVVLTSSSNVTPEVRVPVGANLPPPCEVTISPTSLQFYAGLAVWQTVRLSNTGNTDCRVDGITLAPSTAPFVFDRVLTFPMVLGANSTLDLRLQYSPPPGMATASTAVLRFELDWVHEVALRGEPTAPPGCHLAVDPPLIDFGLVSASGTQTQAMTLTNFGAGGCTIRGVTFDRPGFAATVPNNTVPKQSAVAVPVQMLSTADRSKTSAKMTITSDDTSQPQLEVRLLTGRVRCDPNCMCGPGETPTYWRFSPLSTASAVAPSAGGLGAYQESCDLGRCSPGSIAVEIDRGRLLCSTLAPPTCPQGQGLDFLIDGWRCVPCPLVVQYGSIFNYQRACADVPRLTCPAGEAPTFDARAKQWACAPTCNNGLYDQRQYGGQLVCVPC